MSYSSVLFFYPSLLENSSHVWAFAADSNLKLWNDLPSIAVQAVKLQRFKLGANAFLWDKAGRWFTLYSCF